MSCSNTTHTRLNAMSAEQDPTVRATGLTGKHRATGLDSEQLVTLKRLASDALKYEGNQLTTDLCAFVTTKYLSTTARVALYLKGAEARSRAWKGRGSEPRAWGRRAL